MCISISTGQVTYTRAPTMAIGDSMTLGSVGLIGGYRVPLLALAPDLKFVGRLDSFGAHEGYGGNTIAQITTHVDSIINNFAPKLILLLAGYNDIAIPHTASTIAADLFTFATSLAAKTSSPLVLVSNLPPNADPTVAAINAALPGAFSGAGPNVRRVDICSAMVLATDIGGDGVHPSASGYSKMASAWAANLPVGP